MKDHVVAQGECFSSIAFENGFFVETLVSHPGNEALKGKRENPRILEPGDVVHVPDLRQRTVECATGKRHTFRRKSVPEALNIQFVADGVPRADLPFVLDIDDAKYRGKTDGDGWLRHSISPNAKHVTLVLDAREGGANEEYELMMRQLDPVETISGQQARLRNLGYFGGEVDGKAGPDTLTALRMFQQSEGLTESDQADASTREALVRVHNC